MPPPPLLLPAASLARPPPAPPLPPWTYWEPVAMSPLSSGPPVGLPIAETELVWTAGAKARWESAPAALRDQVVSRGFAVAVPPQGVTSLGQFYAGLRDAGVASLVTLDALYFASHLAVERALADVDARVLLPALSTLLRRLDVRLSAEARGARADLEPAYLTARGVVSVALALGDAAYVPPKEVSALVDGEKARVLAHTGLGLSPWLGVPLDYSAMVPRGCAAADNPHAGWARAVAWLAGASLALAGRGEREVMAQVDVATARAHTRAALLLSRLVQPEVDAEASHAWGQWERTSELMAGEADDATPRVLLAAAEKVGLDLTDGKWFANVARIDKVRHAAATLRVARADDGSGGTRVPARGMDPTERIGVLAPGFRLLAPRATPDGELLQSLVFPMVGALSRPEAPRTARDGVRALPSALDVASWLGSREARSALHDEGDDAYALYVENLERAMGGRPASGAAERHRDPYSSLIDALETWLGPSAGDSFHAGAGSVEWGKRKAEVALAAWTELRHDATAMSRGGAGDVAPSSDGASEAAPLHGEHQKEASDPDGAENTGEAPTFVEAHPEAIAKLLGVVRQTSRALKAEAALDARSAGVVALDAAESLISAALTAATSEANGKPIPASVASTLASLPSKLQALEASMRRWNGGEVPVVVDVHTDVASGRALEQALGRVQEAWMVVREPGPSGRCRLAIGASIPHYELVQSASDRLTDAAWRARLDAQGDPKPGPLARAYLFAPGAP